MKGYGTALTLFAIIEICGWLLVAVTILFVFVGIGDNASERAIVTLPVAISGLFLVAIAQFSRAQIHTAINTSEILAVLRASLSDRRDSVSDTQVPTDPSPPDHVAAREAAYGKPRRNYRGYMIVRETRGASVDGRKFLTEAHAEQWVDEFITKDKRKE